MTSNPAPFSRPRLHALDAARVLGIVAMVFGHTLDALLSPAARTEPGVLLYWQFRGLTAPLFLIVSGWAVATAISRSRATGFAILRHRLPRVLMLLGAGCFLRWPGWDMPGLFAGSLPVWSQFLTLDALQLIALCLFVTALTDSLFRDRVRRWQLWLIFGALIMLALLGAAYALAHPEMSIRQPATTLLVMLWRQLWGGASPFPLLPWSAYFFSGVLIALSMSENPGRRQAAALGGIGAVLFLAGMHYMTGNELPNDPILVLFRAGQIFMILALLWLVPKQSIRPIAPLGRRSLGIYVVHMMIVYGWAGFPSLNWLLGKSLSLWPALGIGLTVLLVSFALLQLIHYAGAAAALHISKLTRIFHQGS